MVDIQATPSPTSGYRFAAHDEKGQEIGYCYLIVISNRPETCFGFFENLFVDPKYRGHGIGTSLVETVVKKAKELGCYKLICTSRNDNVLAHKLYLKLGFTDWGREFRLDLPIPKLP
jgi:GNAT superfamily N-acetyltransferase